MVPAKLSSVLLITLCISVGVNIWQWQQRSYREFQPTAESDSVQPRVDVKTSPKNSADPSPSLSELVIVWFNDQQHDRAIQAYEWLQQTDDRQAKSVFVQLVDELNQRLDIADTDFAEIALTSWLQSYPYNIQLRLVFATLCEQEKRYEDASNVYFDLADETSSDVQQRRFLAHARELSDQYLNVLADSQRWDLVIEFIDQLIWREPDYIPHVIKLAKAYIANNQKDQARIHLTTASHYPEFQREAERLLAAITPEQKTPETPRRVRRGTEIALKPLDNHFLVPLKINGRAQASLIIDTGASLTVLSRSSFERLNISRSARFINTARMNTAGGIANADIYQVSEMSVGQFVIKNERIAVMELPGLSPSDGLLGMNFLGAFNFQINTEAKTLSLARK